MTTSAPQPDGGSGYWPTPRAADGMIHGSIAAARRRVLTPGRRWRANLEEAVALNGDQLPPKPSEPDPQLTLFAADSPASPSASPAKASRRRIAGGSGQRSQTSFATYDPGTSSWKTFQDCLDGASVTYSETWPASGMTRNGIAYQRSSSVPPIYATESGSWPTPSATLGTNGGLVTPAKARERRGTLIEALSARTVWPTPTVGDSRNSRNATANRSPGSSHHPGTTLSDAIRMAVQLWPTPGAANANDNARGSNARKAAQANGTYISGQLNPTWVEWLQGYPLGWTEI
jgi:hypothetical protein